MPNRWIGQKLQKHMEETGVIYVRWMLLFLLAKGRKAGSKLRERWDLSGGQEDRQKRQERKSKR